MPWLALRDQKSSLQPFRFTKNGERKNLNPVVAKMLTSAIGRLSEILKGLQEINAHFDSITG